MFGWHMPDWLFLPGRAKPGLRAGNGELSFHVFKNICYFPLLVLMGIYHYWKHVYVSRGLKQMEVSISLRMIFVGLAAAGFLSDSAALKRRWRFALAGRELGLGRLKFGLAPPSNHGSCHEGLGILLSFRGNTSVHFHCLEEVYIIRDAAHL